MDAGAPLPFVWCCTGLYERQLNFTLQKMVFHQTESCLKLTAAVGTIQDLLVWMPLLESPEWRSHPKGKTTP